MYRRTLPTVRRPRRQHGLTLVELMVAAVIGLILTGGAIQIFLSSKKAFATTDAVSRVQENGRYALQFMARDIRGAGFWGCAQDVEMANQTQYTGGGTPPFNFGGDPIVGTEGASGAPDSLTMRMAAQDRRKALVKQMPNTSANLFFSSVANVKAGDIMIITDCEAADIFMVSGVNSNNANLGHNTGNTYNGVVNKQKEFSRNYGTSATAYSAREKTYSIGTTPGGEPALVRTTNGVSEVLVAGISDMQLTYGVDTDNDETVNVYVAAPDVGNWNNVLAVRIALLVRSKDDNVLDTPETYSYNGATVTAPDRRLYQPFTATVTIRNRLP